MQTLQTFAAVLKEDYLDEIKDNVNNGANYFVKRLMEKVENIGGGGKQFYVPVHYGRNNGVGFIDESGDLPTAGKQGYKESTGKVNHLAGRLQITEAVISASSKDAAAFARAVDLEVKNLTRDLKNVKALSSMGNGTGAFATFATNASGTTLTVNNVNGFYIGQRIDIYTLPSTSVATNREITDINYNNKTISITGAAIATTAGAVAVPAGSLGKAFMGLSGIISDNITLQNLDPTSDTWWKANVLGNGGTGRPLTELLMRNLVDRVDTVSGKQVEWLSCSFGVRAAYESLLQSMRRTVNSLDLGGGYTALEFDGMPLIADRYHQKGEIMCGNWDDLGWYQTRELGFMDQDGSMFHRVPNKAAYEATALEFGTMVCFARNAFGALKDINEASGY